MGGTLLVGGEDMPDFVLIVIQLVIEVQDGTAGIAENGVHLLLQQALHDGLGGSDFQYRSSSEKDVKSSRCPSAGR
jgi:hypothetical protein